MLIELQSRTVLKRETPCQWEAWHRLGSTLTDTVLIFYFYDMIEKITIWKEQEQFGSAGVCSANTDVGTQTLPKDTSCTRTSQSKVGAAGPGEGALVEEPARHRWALKLVAGADLQRHRRGGAAAACAEPG